jgi:ElaB/YqjD/DUF883 family membrane-anchored ribosome-binding protein
MDDFNKQANDFPNEGQASSSGAGTAARMKEKLSDQAADAKEKIADFGRQTIDTIDASRPAAAQALSQTASSLHSGGDQISNVAHSTADSIQATADYVRNTDLKGMANDVQDLVKRYPGQSLAAAAVLGFLVARGLRSSN